MCEITDTSRVPQLPSDRPEDGYQNFRVDLHDRFAQLTSSQSTPIPLFTTNADHLYDVFLGTLPEEARQHYTCGECRRFVEHYGGLVTIDDAGNKHSAIWDVDSVPPFFKPPVNAMLKVIESAKVTGVFLSNVPKLGVPKTGEWNHMAVTLPRAYLLTSRLQTPHQAMAEKLEDFKTLVSAIREYPLPVVEKVDSLLQADVLYRADRCRPIAKWFKEVCQDWANAPDSEKRSNLVWRKVATAPAGCCHIKSSMIGTLLDDVAAGMSFDKIKVRFEEKMNPTTYMRSQSAPTQGNINQAEKIVKDLGIENSLRRRYARIEEIPEFIWRSKGNTLASKIGGIFSGIVAKAQTATPSPTNGPLPSAVMTWEKFQRTVLPDADKIEVRADNPSRFAALVTAVDPEAPNILRWGNPFSWYYHGGVDGEIRRRVERAGGRYEDNDIRCSLIWETYTDLDLHCITPRGQHIYFGEKRDNTGGWLDVDANGGSPMTTEPVENIRWSVGNAPAGHYKFYVHNYAHRDGRRSVPFKAELDVKGEVHVFHGVSDHGDTRETVFEFDYSATTGRITSMTSKESVPVSADGTWNVAPSGFLPVQGITHSPNLWGDNPSPGSGSHVFFLIDGCRDKSSGKGRGFFNEMLMGDLHEVRKTLEAYCASASIEEAESASACGVGYSKDNEWNLTVKVTSGNSSRIITIDRWD